LAANVVAESEHLAGGVLLGVGTFLAIALHKPLDALTITVLMRKGGWSGAATQLVNGSFALMCPLGALLFWLGIQEATGQKDLVVGAALAFSAGVFLCISLGDLLPELQFHSHDRLKLSAALLLGVALAYGIGFLEPMHAHAPSAELHPHEHGHDGHQH
jgi:zinc and cadmium transporter